MLLERYDMRTLRCPSIIVKVESEGFLFAIGTEHGARNFAWKESIERYSVRNFL